MIFRLLFAKLFGRRLVNLRNSAVSICRIVRSTSEGELYVLYYSGCPIFINRPGHHWVVTTIWAPKELLKELLADPNKRTL